MTLNTWNIHVSTTGMPDKVASAFAKLNTDLFGAEYSFIAYLGDQQVHGINHAVLAEQVLTTGRDTRNIVVVIFNEKPNEVVATLAAVERVVEGGAEFGGIDIDPKTKGMPLEALATWMKAFDGYVGAKIEPPFVYLGKQEVNGTNYIFATEVEPITLTNTRKAYIVTLNDTTGMVAMKDILTDKYEESLGYTFTWLTGGIGKPLGEWP